MNIQPYTTVYTSVYYESSGDSVQSSLVFSVQLILHDRIQNKSFLFDLFSFERIVRMSTLVQKMVADIKSLFIPAAFLEEVRPSRASEPN